MEEFRKSLQIQEDRLMSPERQELHDLIMKRREVEVPAVEYMLKHPLSWAEIEEQIKWNTP